MKEYMRLESDSIGTMEVPEDAYYGVQALRAKENFPITGTRLHPVFIKNLAKIKRAAAITNRKAGRLKPEIANAIESACNEVVCGMFDKEFIVDGIQGGAGTSANMNMNEVIANRATEILGGNFRDKAHEKKENIVHPNDHVNRGQSSNDTFPTALHIMAVYEVEKLLIPAIDRLRGSLQSRVEAFKDIIKTGRTHLQDATPLTLGQEFSGYVSMLDHSKAQILKALDSCRELAIGGTAVGTGLNAPEGYDVLVAAEISRATGLKFVSDPNKFHGLTSHDAVVFLEGALKGLAADLMKIANDIRWLASGPRCGLGELNIPANEPGSSIMPGKVNPTQCEAVTMVAVQVMGNDAAIGFAASQGNFELNVFKPVIAYNLLQSIRLLADVEVSFAEHCVDGITANKEKIDYFLNRSLMNVTALSPLIGYENAAKVAHYAHENDLSLRDAALALKVCTPEEFDATVVPANMVHPLKKAK